MAQVLVTIPDIWAPLLVQAECKNNGYKPTVLNPETGEQIANPVTAAQFAFACRIKYLKDNLKAALVPDLAKADRAAKIAEIDAIQITMEIVVPPG